jgi:hypothetical protein
MRPRVKYEFQHVVTLLPSQSGRPGHSYLVKVDLRTIGEIWISGSLPGERWKWAPKKYLQSDWLSADGKNTESHPLLPCGHSRNNYDNCSQALCALLAFASFGSNEGCGGPMECDG